MDELDDNTVERAFGGDAGAFSRVVVRYQGPVLGLCVRMLRGAEGEDAAQETFLRAFVHRERFERGRPVLPWLLAIAHRLCLDRIRKHKPDLDPEIGERSAAAEASDAEQRLIASEQVARLQGRLSAMDERQREAILLFHLEGLSYREIADVLAVPLGTVMTWLHRGRSELRRALESECAREEP
jgi:RNA polymerase sigma-70 factor, ECF subfamily